MINIVAIALTIVNTLSLFFIFCAMIGIWEYVKQINEQMKNLRFDNYKHLNRVEFLNAMRNINSRLDMMNVPKSNESYESDYFCGVPSTSIGCSGSYTYSDLERARNDS